VDFLDNAVPLVEGIVREQLAEQVIQSLDGVPVNCGRFCKFQLGDGEIILPGHLLVRHLPLGSLGELLHLFLELLELLGSGVKRWAKLLVVQNAEIHLIPLKVHLGVACVVHKIADVLVTFGQPHRNCVRYGEPLGVLVLGVGDGGSLSDPSPFAICVSDIFWAHDAQFSEKDEVQRRALDKLLEGQLSVALGEQVRWASRPFCDERNLATPTLNSAELRRITHGCFCESRRQQQTHYGRRP
jgi:hypothetical protein